MKLAGLIYDDSLHYLDHLGPFCSELKCPLIICDKALKDLADEFYPDLNTIQIDLFNLSLPENIITCDSAPLIKAAFPNQKTRTIWLPHGRSDKGFKIDFFEVLKEEKIVLVYGPDMEKQLENKGVLAKKIQIGNFRKNYFLKNKKFYEKKVPFYNLENKILYAPSWDDNETDCSFWNAFPHFSQNLPKNVNLLIKFHPNTLKKHEPDIEILLGRYQKENIYVLPTFPPIYPLIHQMSAYIGDMSSIGYDYLSMKGPMFFLNARLNLPLFRCGFSIDPKTFDFTLKFPDNQQRKELDHQTFALSNFEAIKKELFCAL